MGKYVKPAQVAKWANSENPTRAILDDGFSYSTVSRYLAGDYNAMLDPEWKPAKRHRKKKPIEADNPVTIESAIKPHGIRAAARTDAV